MEDEVVENEGKFELWRMVDEWRESPKMVGCVVIYRLRRLRELVRVK